MMINLAKRRAAGARFKVYGLLSILFVIALMIAFFSTLVMQGWPAFVRANITLPIDGKRYELSQENIYHILYEGLEKTTHHTLLSSEELLDLLSPASCWQLHQLMLQKESLPHEYHFRASYTVDQWLKKRWLSQETFKLLPLSLKQVQKLEELLLQGKLQLRFNDNFLTRGDSQESEIAGIFTAMIGSLLTLCIALGIALPVGLSTAIYLEEFAPRNRFFDLIEVNINNLAAVPTVIFGLLGLAFFLNILHIPRSSSLAGGLTLSLIMLPTIIIASRVALKTVPDSIRYAAQGLGASALQATFHHVLPLALPGIMTGALLGLVRIIGESAPLLMLGMVAFIVDPPTSVFAPATTLPVQIFSWAKNPSAGFVENTSAATLILLLFLLIINVIIVLIKRKIEPK